MSQTFEMKLQNSKTKKFIQLLTALKLALFFSLLIADANAIVIRHDVPAEKYVAKESNFPAIFPIYDDGKIKDCVATLVAPSWALTAAHCTVYLDKKRLAIRPHQVKISGSNYGVIDLFYPKKFGGYTIVRDSKDKITDIIASKDINYQYDIALLKLSKPVENIRPIAIYSGREEVDKKVLFLGWGDYSTGDVGINNDKPTNDRNFRMATNQIDSIDENQLFFDFDDPTTTDSDALPLEGVSGPGDSGGPALLKTDTGYLILGISSRGSYSENLSPQPKNTGKYGWLEFYTRVSSVAGWLKDIMNKY